jgi:predicted acyltransferase (DUF342 family)
MVAAIGIMAVMMIVLMTLSASSLNAAGFATSTRAGVQARAAADAGIDAVGAKLMSGSFVCTLNGSDPVYTATVTYANSAGTAMACSGASLSGTPASARIYSRGQAGNTSVSGGSVAQNSQVVGATVNIVVTAATTAASSKAVFSEGDLTLTNNTSALESAPGLADANLYSNGKIICKTQAEIQGRVYAQGDFTVENNCNVTGSVWSGGNVNLSNSAVDIGGNVFAAGTSTLQAGRAHVDGSVIANGPVALPDSASIACGASGQNANVCGSVYSLNGAITMGNNAKILGSAYARGPVFIGNSGGTTIGQNAVSLTGNLDGQNNPTIGGTASVGGAISSNVSGSKSSWCDSSSATTTVPACVSPNPILPLPSVAAPAFAVPQPLYSPTTPSNLGTAAAVVKVIAPPRESMTRIPSTNLAANWSGWTIVQNTTLCATAGSFGAKLKTVMDAYPATAKLLIQINGCTAPVALNNDTITLTKDVALMSPNGFSSSNELTILSSSSTVRELAWIVPSDAPGVTWTAKDAAYPAQLSPTCSASLSPNISMSKLSSLTNVKWMIYTPCLASLSFDHKNFEGQIVAGAVDMSTGGNLKWANMGISGAIGTGGASTPATLTVTLTSRYDVSG